MHFRFGNSPNVIKAVEYANAQGLSPWVSRATTAASSGKIVKYSVHIPIADMQVTEDLHMVLDHMAYSILGKEKFYLKSRPRALFRKSPRGVRGKLPGQHRCRAPRS